LPLDPARSEDCFRRCTQRARRRRSLGPRKHSLDEGDARRPPHGVLPGKLLPTVRRPRPAAITRKRLCVTTVAGDLVGAEGRLGTGLPQASLIQASMMSALRGMPLFRRRSSACSMLEIKSRSIAHLSVICRLTLNRWPIMCSARGRSASIRRSTRLLRSNSAARGPGEAYYRNHCVAFDRLRRLKDNWVFATRSFQYLWLDTSPFSGNAFPLFPDGVQ